jgi:NaMN:DMB phosphoribosyltransferase
MNADEFLAAVDIGYRTVPSDSDLLAVGEMGIGNTTVASAVCAALLGGGARWVMPHCTQKLTHSTNLAASSIASQGRR